VHSYIMCIMCIMWSRVLCGIMLYVYYVDLCILCIMWNYVFCGFMYSVDSYIMCIM